MRVIRNTVPALMLAAAALTVAADPASAQALTPMRGQVKSFTDQAAFRVFPANPYARRIKVEVKVYDETFAPIAAFVSPPVALLAPEDNRGVMVLVPFEGKTERRIRICAESVPFEDKATRLRTQVCGRFLAQRVQ